MTDNEWKNFEKDDVLVLHPSFLYWIVVNIPSVLLMGLIVIIYNEIDGLYNLYIYYSVGIILVFLFLRIIWSFIRLSSFEWKIETERMKFSRGVFRTYTDCTELYRVCDYKGDDGSFVEKIFGLYNYYFITTEKETPVIIIFGIKKDDRIEKLVRDRVELVKEKKSVVEITNK